MGFSCGIVGLPNAGKSTLFNALTTGSQMVAPYPFSTIDPKEGKVAVPDQRLDQLARLQKPQKTTPSHLTFVDIAGLVQGASKGEGLGNRFLAHIREMDVVALVLRLFADENVSHVAGRLDPLEDFHTLRTELLLADLDSLERRQEKDQKAAKVGDKVAGARAAAAQRLIDQVSAGRGLFGLAPHDEVEETLRRELFLLTDKPCFVLANVDEAGFSGGPAFQTLAAALAAEGLQCLPLCGKLEMELAALDDPAERQEMMEALGLQRSALDQVVLAGYRLLNLRTFYTLVGTELRAWTIPEGTGAAQAAGRIHSDMEAGFIKAEVISFAHFVEYGSEARVRDHGLARVEGRDYEVADGDIVRFHFRP